MKPLITIVVCTYNDESTIGTVLDAITRLTYSPLEIIVIDDASTDATSTIVSRYAVTAIRNPSNRGLGYNQNLGLSRANGEFIAMIQSDCEVLGADWVDRMLEPMEKNVGVVVSQRFINSFRLLPAGARFFNAVAPQDLENKDRTPLELQYCRGKADLYRASMLRDLNGWNSDFFTAGEDTDLSIRIRQKGFRILLHPTASVHYLFSGRQISIGGGLRKAFLYGKVAFQLYELHGYDGIQSRTYLTTLLAILCLPLPDFAASIAGGLLFLYSFTCKIQTKSGNGFAFGIPSLIAAGFLFMLNSPHNLQGLLRAPVAGIALAGVAYTGYLAAKNTYRNFQKGEKVSRLPATFLFCAAWRIISGLGYMAGAIESLGKRKRSLEKYEDPAH